MSTNNSILPYRKNVCILIFKDRNNLFLGERAGEPGVWQFPQGGVEEGFSLEENVLREAEEELGVPAELFKIEARLKHTHKYDFFNTPEYAINKFRGQEQSFWLVKFLGQDSDINLGKFEREFDNWCWVDAAGIRLKADPKRLAGYEGALAEFLSIVQN